MGLRHRTWAWVVAAAAGLSSGLAGAQSPVINGTTPQAVAPGTTQTIKVRGGSLAGPTAWWSSFATTATLATDVPENGKNPAEIAYSLAIPPEAGIGVHGIRVANPAGVSNLWLVMVDDLPSVAQVKPNADITQAQVVAVPAGIDGQVDALGRNFYKFTAAAGQVLSFEVVARRLGSPLDPMVRILDTNGRELAYSDDAPGLGGDSRLSHTFAAAGDYFVEVRDIRYQGGGNFNYRLRIGNFPCVNTPYPLGVKRGTAADVSVTGLNTAGATPVSVNVPLENPAQWINVGFKLPNGTGSGFGSLSVTSADEALEVEPNNEQPMATKVALGAHLNGRFEQPGDVDRFTFTAKAGQRFLLAGVTRQQGSPTDLFLRLLNPAGGQVAAADDNGPNEGIIDFTFPADGDYTLLVEDLHRRGGSEFAYRVSVTPFQAGFDLAVSTDTLNVPLQGIKHFTVTAVRRGYDGPIELALADAPANVAATPCVIGPGQTTAILTVLNTGLNPDGQIYPTKVIGKAKIGEAEITEFATASAAQKATFANMPVPPKVLQSAIAVGATAQPFFVLRTEPAELVFGKNLSASVKIKTMRTDFVEAITLAVEPAQNGLPAGITAAVKPIDKDQGEVEIVFTANAQAPLGLFQGVLLGTGKKGDATVVQAAPAIRLRLEAPYSLKIEIGEGKVAKGGTLKGKVVATRNPAYNGPIVLTFANLPAGVTAAPATIAEGQAEVEVVLTVAADAAAATVENVVVSGAGNVGDAKFAENSGNAKLIVE